MASFIKRLQDNAFKSLDITNYNPDNHGWMQENLGELFKTYLTDNTNTVVEVGTWKGLSTMTMANIIKERFGTSEAAPKLIAIDNWLGAPEFWTWGIDDPTRGSSLNLINGYPSVFYTFTKNVKSVGLEDVIAPLPISSIQGADILNYYKIQADIIYVDAAHEYEPVKSDLEAYWNILKPGGIMFGDDYSDYWPGLIKATNEFAAKQGIKPEINGVIWKLTKPL